MSILPDKDPICMELSFNYLSMKSRLIYLQCGVAAAESKVKLFHQRSCQKEEALAILLALLTQANLLCVAVLC